MNIAILIISLLALLVSWRSWVFAERAFSLSLFNNRYKFYSQLRHYLVELLDIIDGLGRAPTEREILIKKIKLLTVEAKYLFGDKIEDFLINICDQINTLPLDRLDDDDLKARLHDMLGSDESKNIDSYFNKYLYHSSFKKPIGFLNNLCDK